MTEEKSWQELIDEGGKLFEQRRLAQAELRFLDAMKLSESFPQEDPRRATSLNNLAALYHSQGKYAFAEDHYKRALAINEKLFGNESLEVARNLYNLAVLYSAKSRFDEAEPLYAKSLTIKEKLLGANHPDLLHHLKQHAELLRRMGREDDATNMLARSAAL
jgi:tetratricopeptide (TPR) repeat protein